MTGVQTCALPISNGYEVLGNSPEEFAAQIRAQTTLVAGIVKSAGIKPE